MLPLTLQGSSSGSQRWAGAGQQKIKLPAWRGSPSGVSRSPAWQKDSLVSWAWGRCQSFYNGGLRPPNTSFGAAVTKPKLAPWLWAEGGGGGERRGRLFRRLCQAGEGGVLGLCKTDSFPPGRSCPGHASSLLLSPRSHAWSLTTLQRLFD